MKVLIIGASGFVGPVLSREIAKRYPNVEIFGTYYIHQEVDRIGDVKPYYLDISDKKNVDAILYEIQPDWIIHLAAQSSARISWENPSLTFQINVNGTINLLESIKEFSNKSRILLVGSSEEYGIVDEKPIDENRTLRPMNPYGVSKMTQEELGRLYVKVHNLDIVFTRSFNHIGPGQEPVFVIPDWCKQIAEIERGEIPPVINVGNLSVKRDFSHVSDVVNSYIDLLEKGETGAYYNVGSGIVSTLKEILDTLISYSDKDIEVHIDNKRLRPAENPVICCDRSKLNAISNSSYRSIEESLKEVLEYWRND